MNQVAIPASVATAFLLVVSPAATQAQLPAEWRFCINEGKPYAPDIVIDGCTAALQSGRHEPRVRAVAFNNRALAYYALRASRTLQNLDPIPQADIPDF